MFSRRLHRVLGLLLALPVILWGATGILFHVKYRYAEAYESLSVPHASEADWNGAGLAPADVIKRGLAEPPLTLATHPSGRLTWFGRHGVEPVAVDAHSGELLPAASTEQANAWVLAAIANSANAPRYGTATASVPTTHRSMRTGTVDPALAVSMSGGKTVTVDLITGELSQTGTLNDFIDATYRIHYLQWTPWPLVNAGLVILAIALLVSLVASGLRMALRTR